MRGSAKATADYDRSFTPPTRHVLRTASGRGGGYGATLDIKRTHSIIKQQGEGGGRTEFKKRKKKNSTPGFIPGCTVTGADLANSPVFLRKKLNLLENVDDRILSKPAH